jgi:hypothetical protein
MICDSQIHGKSGAPSLFLRLRSAVVVFASRSLLTLFRARVEYTGHVKRCEFVPHSSCGANFFFIRAALLLIFFFSFSFFHQGMNDQQGTPTQ